MKQILIVLLSVVLLNKYTQKINLIIQQVSIDNVCNFVKYVLRVLTTD